MANFVLSLEEDGLLIVRNSYLLLRHICTYQLTPLSKECQNNCRSVTVLRLIILPPFSQVNVISSFGARTPPTPKID